MTRRYRLLALTLILSTLAGCQSLSRRRAEWYPPIVATPHAPEDASTSPQAMAELAYADGIERELDDDAACVDCYFHAITLVWPEVERELLMAGTGLDRSAELYRSSLIRLISAGQHLHRFDPRNGLTVWTQAGWRTIPTSCHGFPWQMLDFDYLLPAGEYESKELNTSYCCSGLGVPTVTMHCRRPQEQFHRDQQAFPATVVLRPANPIGSFTASSLAIEFYNPVTISSITLGGRSVALARDITAPMAYALSRTKREYLAGFLQPESTSESAGLYMLEPYQPGKIPVVFIHGLLSSRLTWANVANEIYAAPDLYGRIQLWAYEYDTGEPFLRSAANLRQRLRQIQEYVDPAGMDPALRQMVLVGHSMGGLIAKLQVTQSGTTMWDSVSCQPLETIQTTPAARQRLAELLFFEPSRSITRVVFMGTPHQGSPWAERPIGRIASTLVNEPLESQEAHEQLIDDNPDAFTDEFSRRIPTSIDLLAPSSDLLQGMDRLPYAPHVQLHTIAGFGYCIPGAVDSDRVVPLESARKPGVVTERLIESKHEKIHHNPEGVQELLCILRNHIHGVSCHEKGAGVIVESTPVLFSSGRGGENKDRPESDRYRD